MRTWQMQQAKARLLELARLAEIEGAQDITLNGRSVVDSARALMLGRLMQYERRPELQHRVHTNGAATQP